MRTRASTSKGKAATPGGTLPELLPEDGRSYDFLLKFLVAAIGEDGLASLHGLSEGGERSQNLLEELRWMRELFYGLHLLSAEDVGMAPALRPDEPVDRAACRAKAREWLASYRDDADLKVDTRVSVPIYFDVARQRTRLWTTIGVRLAKFNVSYARPPGSARTTEKGDGRSITPDQLEAAEYVIAVDSSPRSKSPASSP